MPLLGHNRAKALPLPRLGHYTAVIVPLLDQMWAQQVLQDVHIT